MQGPESDQYAVNFHEEDEDFREKMKELQGYIKMVISACPSTWFHAIHFHFGLYSYLTDFWSWLTCVLLWKLVTFC